MANVLDAEKRQQILALGKLGWTLRRIEQATGIRRETVSRYLKLAGIEVRPPGRWFAERGEVPDGALAKKLNPASRSEFRRPNRSPAKKKCGSAGPRPFPLA